MDCLKKILNVKSIMTFVLTAVFAYLAIVGAVDAKDFTQVFLMVVSFYFGTQIEKKNTPLK